MISEEPLIEVAEDHCLCTCPENMTREFGWALLHKVVELEQRSPLPPLFVFDFESVKSLQRGFFRPMFQFCEVLKKAGCYLATINIPGEISRQITGAGLEGVFSPKESLLRARELLGFAASRSEILKNFVTPFINATKSVLEIQANLKPKAEKPYLKEGPGPSDICIAGIISIKSGVFCGTVALLFTEQAFLHVFSSMMGEVVSEISLESRDAAGEILNIIFGQANSVLHEKHYHIENAIPSVIVGEQLKVIEMSRGKSVVLPFKTDAGPLYLEISLDPT